MAQLFTITKVSVSAKSFVARVQLDKDAPLTTDENNVAAQATDIALELLPDLATHACFGDTDRYFGEVIKSTELAHLLEHVTVELLAQSKHVGEVVAGKITVFGDKNDRTFVIELSCPDDVLVAAALSSAAWLLDWCFAAAQKYSGLQSEDLEEVERAEAQEIAPTPDISATVAGLDALIDQLNEQEAEAQVESESEDESDSDGTQVIGATSDFAESETDEEGTQVIGETTDFVPEATETEVEESVEPEAEIKAEADAEADSAETAEPAQEVAEDDNVIQLELSGQPRRQPLR